jgi:glutamate-1-semialdehyde 2,1-aminomutase
MNVLNEETIETMNKKADHIKKTLNLWAEEKNIPLSIMGEFSILGYIFTKEPGQKITTIRDYWKYTDENAMEIYAMEMATRGFYPVTRGQIALTVPMTDADIAGYIEATKEVVLEMYQ